ncbi:MAG TPA: type III pantothenate kinase [Alcaligenes sp.]|nr:type III pantothenate kinase [Alcaligenes sp.]HRL27863.1 type III pantothenate kinase [Alcaligenes sp.]
MTLLIDSGNTRIKLGWCHPVTGAREAMALSLRADQLDQLPALLQAHQAPLQDIKRCSGPRAIGVNVAGTHVQALIDQAMHALGLSPVRWLRSEAKAFGLRNGYKRAEQLGADRWVALLGLCDLLQNASYADHPALLASFGTATTIDMLGPVQTNERNFLGGTILPGPSLMLSSLKQNTAQLPQAHGRISPFPTDTDAAICTGVAAAQAGAVLRQWEQGRLQFGVPPLLFIAGGGRDLILPELHQQLAHHCRLINTVPPPAQNLDTPTLSGLALYASAPRL